MLNKDKGKMYQIKVRKEDLLEKMRQNLNEHIETYEASVIGFHKKVRDDLATLVKKLEDPSQEPPTHLSWTKPVSFAKDYNRAIGMLEMTVEDIIELDENQYKKYVQDDWDWKISFMTTASGYCGDLTKKF